MSAPVDTTAAMTEPAETTAATADPLAPQPQGSALPAAAMQLEPPVAKVTRGAVSPNAVIGVLGALIAALLAAMMGLLIWQFGLLGDSIDSLGTRIDSLGTRIDGLGTRIDNQDARIDSLGSELRGEIGMLRTEMQAGFRSINETLLDHTGRLARLEAVTVEPVPAS